MEKKFPSLCLSPHPSARSVLVFNWINERIRQIISRAISGGCVKEEVNCFSLFQMFISQLIPESILLLFFSSEQATLGKFDWAKVSLNSTPGAFQDLSLGCSFFRLLFCAFYISFHMNIYVLCCLGGGERFFSKYVVSHCAFNPH